MWALLFPVYESPIRDIMLVSSPAAPIPCIILRVSSILYVGENAAIPPYNPYEIKEYTSIGFLPYLSANPPMNSAKIISGRINNDAINPTLCSDI